MKIIPAIDILGGKCVRLSKGNFATSKIYHDDPIAVAMQFEDAGITHLHLVDLEGARSGQIVNGSILEKMARQTRLKIDFGGGVTSNAEIQKAFDLGASQVTAGSIAVRNPSLVEEWLTKYDAYRIILGADCHNRKIFINGWEEESANDIMGYIKSYQQKGIRRVICTDIARDGMLQGPSKALYLEIITSTGIKLTASGGITTIKDVHAMKEIGCDGVIIGKALYEGTIKLKELSRLC